MSGFAPVRIAFVHSAQLPFGGGNGFAMEAAGSRPCTIHFREESDQ